MAAGAARPLKFKITNMLYKHMKPSFSQTYIDLLLLIVVYDFLGGGENWGVA
jgi:hypothetical protein